MKYVLILTTLFAVACGQNDSANIDANNEIDTNSEEITLVKSEEIHVVSPMSWESDCSKQAPNSGGVRLSDINPIDLFKDVTIDQIINFGNQAWKVLKENEPVIDAKTMSASALPAGLKCWNQLSNWSRTRAETYRVTYKNLYGIDVVDLEFRLLYNHGGRLNGKGRYLTNATIQYGTLDVMWGFVVNANVEVPPVVNTGSETDPVAGMNVNFNWSVNTRPLSLRKLNKSVSFYLSGDGAPTQILR